MFHAPFSSAAAARIRISELIGALATHSTSPRELAGPAMRSAFIGGAIAEWLEPDAVERGDLRYCLLLKDLGCSSNAAHICELYADDDLVFKRGYKTAGTSMAATLRFVFSRSARGASFGERSAKVGNILRNGKAFADELILARCTRGRT